ncbi:PQQ-dependent sugar dehydrogenase [Amycolatopsis sp. EV170708-02-1]|uniref:PQQ-dependent sugar dehydrogenase n=1 Tax=Amycolatopsis sp. EV170708-02-1 TaxID=2919322 RepID=UPI001F0BA5B1|nr:PQQ-dependent sugar dehydrogenase [Amycolatopsis sp. EV170708-02-1]UMP01670.1 PQQ-dependent sugar dehydrogenase [Amycolatopsis sp. EV170708-02-1]
MRNRRSIAAAAAVLTALGVTVVMAPVASAAPALPDGFVVIDLPSGQQPGDLNDAAYLPDGSVVTTGKSGSVRWTSAGGQSNEVASIPVYTGGSLGLTSIAVAPDYATSRTLYTARAVTIGTGDRVLRVSKWHAQGTDSPTALIDESVVLEFPANSDNRGIQDLAVDPTGKAIWIAVGDNATDDTVDTFALRALDPNQPTGKILRVDPSGFGVADNPFYDPTERASWRSRNYLSGLRDPRVALDPRGGVLVTDTGRTAPHEVNIAFPGQSAKWPCWEGNSRTLGYQDLPECARVTNTAPTFEIGPSAGGTVSGAIRYSGESYPEAYRESHFVADKGAGTLSTLRFNSSAQTVNPPAVFASALGSPVSITTAPNGDIVVADAGSSALRRLSYRPGNKAPVADFTATIDPATRTVSFDASLSTDPDFDHLTYQWDFGDGGTGEGRTAQHVYDSEEVKTATLRVKDIHGVVATSTQTITPGMAGPTVTLLPPIQGTVYSSRDTVTISAESDDPIDGPITVSWKAEQRRCPADSSCTITLVRTGTGSPFKVDFPEETDSSLVLTGTVTNGRNVVAKASYVAQPRLARLTVVGSHPAQLTVEPGRSANRMVTAGSPLRISAPHTALDGAGFRRWADSFSTNTHREIRMPAGDLTLRADYLSPIEKRYSEESALRTTLGAPVGHEVIESPGRWQAYANGRVYWTWQTGAKAVYGRIHDKYIALGAHVFLGAPSVDEFPGKAGNGRFSHFTGGPTTGEGTIYWTPDSGAAVIYGPVRDKWIETGSEAGILGHPTTDQATTPDGVGRYSHFVNSSIYWTAETGAHFVMGAIREKWKALGWERYFGYPTTDETGTPDGVGRYNHFSQVGSIYWTPSTGAYEVHGWIRERWAAVGWENGLGYPTTDETWTPNGTGKYNHFRKGNEEHSIYWRFGTNSAFDVRGAIRNRWRQLGWETSYLGFPTSGEYDIPGGKRSDFQNGYIVFTAATGAVLDRRY